MFKPEVVNSDQAEGEGRGEWWEITSDSVRVPRNYQQHWFLFMQLGIRRKKNKIILI